MMNAVVETVMVNSFKVQVYADLYERAARSHSKVLRNFALRGIPKQIYKNRTIFIHVPKNGGTSVSRSLYGRSIGHRSAEFYRRTDPELFASATSFAVLRDPISRFGSACNMLINGGATDVRVPPRVARLLADLRTVPDILDWLEGEGENAFRLNASFRRQSWYVTDAVGKVLVDRLFVLGRDDAELSEMVETLSGKALSHANRGLSKPIELSTSDEARVREFYAPDFELLANVDAMREVTIAAS
ncbi:hypothetical protein [Limimaricola cinnabarinus]|uniref:Sulfotransferase family protein n=1 Tax=Limimaricola cinnabarinus LL-001 TaxID=1337093 RepID=U2YLL5_9RHOB|nr:hypothetical protein [Limimaricola cinnabarinus]GAD55991.1 hypothetical protein MBELCI_2043 [Limimaricola cinnabarinus LL-001]